MRIAGDCLTRRVASWTRTPHAMRAPGHFACARAASSRSLSGKNEVSTLGFLPAATHPPGTGRRTVAQTQRAALDCCAERGRKGGGRGGCSKSKREPVPLASCGRLVLRGGSPTAAMRHHDATTARPRLSDHLVWHVWCAASSTRSQPGRSAPATALSEHDNAPASPAEWRGSAALVGRQPTSSPSS